MDCVQLCQRTVLLPLLRRPQGQQGGPCSGDVLVWGEGDSKVSTPHPACGVCPTLEITYLSRVIEEHASPVCMGCPQAALFSFTNIRPYTLSLCESLGLNTVHLIALFKHVIFNSLLYCAGSDQIFWSIELSWLLSHGGIGKNARSFAPNDPGQ